MIRLLTTILLVALSQAADAARIVSDVYPGDGNQPTHCGYIEGAVTAVEAVTGGVRCSIDVSGVSPGAHTFRVFSKSAAWGGSSHVNFTFTAGQPRGGSGRFTYNPMNVR